METKNNIKQHAIVFFRNGNGHHLYGRVTSDNGNRVTIKALGSKGQEGIYRFQKTNEIFPKHSSLAKLSILDMTELNNTAKDRYEAEKKMIDKKCGHFFSFGNPFGSRDINNLAYADYLAKKKHGNA